MLSVKKLRGESIRATDGDFGSVADFLFDDENWAIRYLVVDTGTLDSRQQSVDFVS